MRFFRVMTLMLIGALLLSACGAATPTAADEVTESGQRFLLSLPRIVVDVDEQGQISVGGLGFADLERFTGQRFQSYIVDPMYVNWMTSTNVQHVELAHSSDGIFLYANGEALPYLAWNGETLSNLGSMADMLAGDLVQIPIARLASLLVPIIQRTGLDIVVRFPTQAGAEPIALRDVSSPPQPVVAEMGEASFVTHVDIDYDATGTPKLAGISSGDLAAAGFSLPVNLAPETMDLIQGYGINAVQVVSRNDGLFIMVNDMPLPNVAWDRALLQSSADFYTQLASANAMNDPYIELVNLIVPQMQMVDFDLKVTFASQ